MGFHYVYIMYPYCNLNISGQLAFVSAVDQKTWRYSYWTDSFCAQDKSPFTSLPIRRFTVSATRKEDPIHKNNSFKLYNMKKVYYFQAPDTNATLRWVHKTLLDVTVEHAGKRKSHFALSGRTIVMDVINIYVIRSKYSKTICRC